MTVLFFPDYSEGNPYQENLARELAASGEPVVMPSPRLVLPLLRPTLAHDDVSVVHLHWLDPFIFSDSVPRTLLKAVSTLLELLALRLLGVSVVWTCHNVTSHETAHPTVEYLFKRIFAGTGLCDWIFVHCGSAKTELVETYDLAESRRETMTVVPHGHYIDNYENATSRAAAREELGVETEGVVFLFFGLIRPYKNVTELVSAFRSIPDQDARLVVAGKPESDRMAERVRDSVGDDDRIETHLGFVPDERVQLYMNAADAVVLPLENISMSGSAMLAMSFGRPLVVPNIGCIADLVSDEGAVVYDPDDPRSLARALKRARSRDLAGMGEHNYRLAERSDWATAAAATVAVYREVTGAVVETGIACGDEQHPPQNDAPSRHD